MPAIPGPMGDLPPSGKPAQPGQPDPAAAMNAAVQPQLAKILADALPQLFALQGQQGAQKGIAGAELGQLGVNYQNTLGQLGLQQTGLGQQQAYQQGQLGLQRTGLEEQLANLAAQYGLTKEQFGLEKQGILSAGGATGTSGTGTQRQALAGEGLQEQRAAQGYQSQQQQLQNALKGLGLTGTYENQQMQNALKGLGLSRTAASGSYGYGQQGIEKSLANTLAQLAQQIGGLNAQTDTQYGQTANAPLMALLGLK